MTDVENTIENTLVMLLAQADSLHETVRNWTDNRHVAGIEERRQLFTKQGLSYRIGGGDSARQAAVRLADELEQSGDVVFSRVRGKRAFWRLSDSADWRLRWACLLTGKSELATGMSAIQIHAAAGHSFNETTGGLVPETALAGGGWGDGRGKLLVVIEEMLMPGLVRGWVDSGSDCHGRVYFGITKSGLRWLTELAAADLAPPDDAYDSKASCRRADEYFAQLQETRRELSAAKGASNHCVVALSAGCFPSKSKSACTPIVDSDGRPLTFSEWSDASEENGRAKTKARTKAKPKARTKANRKIKDA